MSSPVPVPQLTPLQIAMAKAHVAWARRFRPHLLLPKDKP